MNLSLRTFALTAILGAAFSTGCAMDNQTASQAAEGRLVQTKTPPGSCAAACGEQAAEGCWCDELCVEYGDCCADKIDVCDAASCDGNVVTTTSFTPAADGKECANETEHCIDSWCPEAPIAYPACPDGEVVQGAPIFFEGPQGNECMLNTLHCVTNDWSACPQLSPLPPNWCADGEIVKGESSFIPSSDGMMCEMPSVHCVSTKPGVCDAGSCDNGTAITTTSFEPAADGKECPVDTVHCVTNDWSSCPQLSPLPPNWCSDGNIVKGEPKFTGSADGMECQLPSVHCVTNDWSACPQLSPLPPDWCSDGEIVSGGSSFIDSADGMECEIPSVHCLSTDAEMCLL